MASRSIKGRQNIKKKNPSTGVLVALAIVVAFFVSAVVGVWAVGSSWLSDMPDYENADAYNTSAPTVVYASDGKTVLAEFQLENRDPVELSQVSQYVLKGTVATEDERFYEHGGVDMWGIGRAFVNNLMGGELEGASTITQQFVRNTILSSEMDDISLKRKVREAYISIKLEEVYSKDEILLMYLNTINYGSGAYGIEAAAQRYFSKHASDLTIAEAATLVGIPQSPTYNNPITYPENCTKRRNLVLDRMLKNGVITQEEHDAAQAEPLVLNETVPSSTGILKYPYFTSYVRDVLTNANGKYAYSKDELFKGGLSVYTTLDVNMQEAAEKAATEKAAEAGSSFEVALVAIDPDNGYVKALVGGKDYSMSQVNMATGSGGTGRQLGSAFKTFTLVSAIEAGIDPDTLVDASTTVEVGTDKISNINMTNYGTRSIASAFEVSSNTAFIRLIQSIGADKVADTAHRMGITSPLTPVPAMTLGTESVTPLEVSSAYATLANGGTHYDPEVISKIVDRNGSIIIDNSAPSGTRELTPEVSHAAVEVMKGVVTRGTGRAATLSNGQVVAGKTGTTDDYKDSWFCGITPQLSVAVWLGDRSDYSTAKQIPSSVSAASAFSSFMNAALAGKPTEDFPKASDPPYQKDYKDDKNHIGGYYASASDENEVDGKDEDGIGAGGSGNSSHNGSGTGGNGGNGGNGAGTGNNGGGDAGDSGNDSGGDSGGGTDPGGTGDDSGGGDSGGGAVPAA